MGKRMQDIRMIQFKNFEKFQKRDQQTGNLFPVFSYFSSVEVSRVETGRGGKTDCVLKGVYEDMQSRFRRSPEEYQSQQIMMAFTDVKSRSHEAAIRQFWDEQSCAIFFVTLVNVRIGGDMKTTIERIKSIYGPMKNGRYLIYYTLDHSEIVIFYKGSSFQEYTGKVMRLNYIKQGRTGNHIMDTITICGFSEHAREADWEPIDVNLQIDVTDYKCAGAFIKQHCPEGKRWLLGRNNIALCLPGVTLKDLCELYDAYDGSWITTLDLSVQIQPAPGIERLLEGKKALSRNIPILNRRKNALNAAIRRLEDTYQRICRSIGSEPDAVIIRILYDINALVFDIDNAQLAEDLVVVLLPQIEGFVNYILRVCEIICRTEKKDPGISNALQLCWNSFYLNIAALINNTIHTDRKFIQIPHYGAPSFEMPPKIMAYYSLMTHRIASVLNDREDVCYGIMLSPKLINELEVQPFALRDTGEPHQMISVNISERMMYQPRRTVTILGHEIAHFISTGPRNREMRLQQILGYYIDYILQKMFASYKQLLPMVPNAPKRPDDRLELYVSIEERLEFCANLAEELLDEIKASPAISPKNGACPVFNMQEIEQELTILPRRLFSSDRHRDEIFKQFIFPEDPKRPPLYLRSILEKLRFQTGLPSLRRNGSLAGAPPAVAAQVRQHAQTQFLYTLEQFPFFWDAESERQAFRKNTGYLFSEAYADIAMILLFNMSAPEYAALFIDGRQDDKLEETRFVAVVRAMKSQGVLEGWGPGIGRISAEHAWGKKIKELLSACLAKRDSRLKAILKKDVVDMMQISFLAGYLRRCIPDIQALLNKKHLTGTLRESYRAIDFDRSLQNALIKIMEMEAKEADMLKPAANADGLTIS